MPLKPVSYSFPGLGRGFHGLPGLLADSLPDKFGNRLINSWLISQGREPDSMDPVERLCYIGRRGMGALEYGPAKNPHAGRDHLLDIAALVSLANKVLSNREDLVAVFGNGDDSKVMQDILRVGTSAGGARAKALVAWNRQSNKFRSGQINLPAGYEHWLLKFDGVGVGRDTDGRQAVEDGAER